MSNGLLRGLAARALGLEAPLRSQRARGLDRLPDRPGPDADPVPSEVRPPSWSTPVVQSPVVHAPSEQAMEVRKGSASGSPRATAPVDRPGPAETPAPRPGTRQPRQAVHGHDPAAAEPQEPGVMRAAATTTPPPPKPEAHATPASKAFVAPTVQTIPISMPEPLLPLAVPTALPRPAAPSVGAAPRRGLAQRAGTTEAPTEVHVSIGRVELTALAPTTSARATPRREAPAGRSLADYLRGGGPGGRKPT